MKCLKCNAEIADNAKFCPKCGAKVEKVEPINNCPNCGEVLKEGARFCTKCGTKIEKGDGENVIPPPLQPVTEATKTTIVNRDEAPSAVNASKPSPVSILPR